MTFADIRIESDATKLRGDTALEAIAGKVFRVFHLFEIEPLEVVKRDFPEGHMRRPLKLEHLPFGAILFDGVWIRWGLVYVDVEFQKSGQCFLRKARDAGFIAHEV